MSNQRNIVLWLVIIVQYSIKLLCCARNVLFITVDILNRTETVLMKTSSQEFDCANAEHAGNCSFLWEHDGNRLSDKSSVLTLPEDRRGIYTCSAVCSIRGRNCSITPIILNGKFI